MKLSMFLTKYFGKALMLALLLCFTATTLSAQVAGRKEGGTGRSVKGKLSPYGKIEVGMFKLQWFADINGGMRMFGSTSSISDLGLGFSGNAGVGYFFSDRFGLKGRVDYSRFSFTPGVTIESTSGTLIYGEAEAQGGAMSFSFEALTDLIPLLTKKTKVRNWRVILHGGLGYTSYNNKSYKEYQNDIDPDYFQDPVIKGNDDMGNIILGITPQYHISGRWSVNLDYSSFILLKQDFTLDNYNGVRSNGIGHISSVTLGLTFRP
jgi:hypothetical protein